MWINGKYVNSVANKTFDVINPFTEKVIAKVAKGDERDANKAVKAARKAFDSGMWSNKTPFERGKCLWKLADLVEKNVDFLAELEAKNQGKTIKYAKESDFFFIVDNLRFFAGASRMLEGKAAAEYSGMGTSMIKREPLGVVAGIVPWNYPLLLAVWKLGPALATGNTIVMKPASNTPLTLLELAKLTKEAGIPDGVFNVITGPGAIIGDALAKHEDVNMIALTGETETGKELMRLAAENLKKVHLELGGKAPAVVLPDADLKVASEGITVGSFWNSGQDCTAITRVLVHEKHHDKLAKMIAERAKKFRLGNQLDLNTDMGPLVSAKQRERIEKYVKIGVEEGAKIICGGKRPAKLKKGFFFEPTVLTNVQQNMKVWKEEIFGPVLCITKYKTVGDAVKKANDTKYGLAASVWGKDITTAMKVASQIKAGTVWINEHGILCSEMPHGGYKQSGFGKDLSLYALEEYTQIKHVYVDQTGLARKPWHYTVYGKK